MGLLASFIVPHPPLIIPEVGRGEEKKIKKTIEAYKKVAKTVSELKPDTIIVITPHAQSFYDYIKVSVAKSASGDFSSFNAKEVKISCDYDQYFIEAILEKAKSKYFPLTQMGGGDKTLDHGTLIPLYFINQEYQDYQLVRFSLSGLPLMTHYEFGKLLAEVIELGNKNYVLIASGDLSHKLLEEGPYGFQKEGPLFDQKVIEIIKQNRLKKLLDFKEDFIEKASECGLKSFIIMAGALENFQTESTLLSYEGPFGVGYAVASIMTKDKLNKASINESNDLLVDLAKRSILYYLNTKKVLNIPEDTPEYLFQERAGVFVSLKRYGSLRGCIGTIEPVRKNLAEEIIHNAISAAAFDPRFEPVKLAEVDYLSISVDVLKSPEKVYSLKELDPLKYGVIVSSGSRKGLLLPNIEGVETVREQINIALQKAGISSNEQYSLEKFEVIRHI
jgi:AmmeMemoRadiSam system protein A